jgi:hypothetical protein
VEIQTDAWLKLTAAQTRAASTLMQPDMTPWIRWMNAWWAVPKRALPNSESAQTAASSVASAFEASAAAAERESVRAARQAALEDSEVAGWQQGLSPRAADERGKRRRS